MKKVYGCIIAVLNFILLFAGSAVFAADLAPIPDLSPVPSGSVQSQSYGGIIICSAIIIVILLLVIFLIWKPNKNIDKNDNVK